MKPLNISGQDQEEGLSGHILMLHIHFSNFTLENKMSAVLVHQIVALTCVGLYVFEQDLALN